MRKTTFTRFLLQYIIITLFYHLLYLIYFKIFLLTIVLWRSATTTHKFSVAVSRGYPFIMVHYSCPLGQKQDQALVLPEDSFHSVPSMDHRPVGRSVWEGYIYTR